MKLLKISGLILALMLSAPVFSQIILPQLISDGMVLQRNQDIVIWGWASPGEKISLNFMGKRYRSVSDLTGNWEITIPPQKAGGPYSMSLKGKNELKLSNILIGDVWLCAGQSNMVLPMERVKERYPEEISKANYPEIRNFFIPTLSNLQGPGKDLPESSWKSANPEDVLSFGALAYFFGLEIHSHIGVPIGLINASVGGTPIRSWISEEGLEEFPELMKVLQQNKDTAYVNAVLRNIRKHKVVRISADKGRLENPPWYSPAYIPKGWKNIYIPGYWEDQGIRDLDGVVWYRREIELPSNMTNTPARLYMGRIVDADEIFVNGQRIGSISYQYPPRRYSIAEGILKKGSNTIVIRVENTRGKGGFVPDKPYFLQVGDEILDLTGKWEYKVGDVFEPVFENTPGFSFQNQPAALYNAMLAPLRKQALSGILWYQGESDSGQPSEYLQLLPALIRDWRKQWKNEELPFLYVQLANFMERDFLPVESSWAELRDAQLKALSLSNTAMAVAIDLGEWNDIHPLNKKDLGYRLSLGARHMVYGENSLIWSGPLYHSHTIEGNKIIISFDHVGSGLVSIDGEALCQFAIAGADKKFKWAKARIVDNKVEAYHESISEPMYLRYAWSNNPEGANLYNNEGLPASPFQIVPE